MEHADVIKEGNLLHRDCVIIDKFDCKNKRLNP